MTVLIEVSLVMLLRCIRCAAALRLGYSNIRCVAEM